MSEPAITGGCLCGAVRYAVAEPTDNVVHCHCVMCRRASGAPVVTWAVVARDGFRVTKGALTYYRSSAGARRGFCGACGAQITFEADGHPETLDVTVGTVDDPEALPASRQIWTSSKIAWLHLDEDLPSYPAFTPE